MYASRRPSTSRGRDRHVLAVVVLPDTVGFEVALVGQMFGPWMPSIAAATGDTEAPYDVLLAVPTTRRHCRWSRRRTR